jgi:dienelactone hydrolase
MITKDFDYLDGAKRMLGQLADEESATSKRPGMLVVHEGVGIEDHAMVRARMLARLSEVALAADVFGERRRPTNCRKRAR